MQRITVLGASGYLGSAVACALEREGALLRLVGRSWDEDQLAGWDRHEVVTADLNRPGTVAAVVEGSSQIIYLVADLGGADTWRTRSEASRADAVEVSILRSVIDSCRPPRDSDPLDADPIDLVFASTAALNVGHQRDRTSYEGHKQRSEKLIRQATAAGRLRGTCLRLSTLYGTVSGSGRRGRGAVQSMIGQALLGQPISMWGAGGNVRNLLHVDDAARAFVAALQHLDVLRGRTWDVGARTPVALRDLTALVAETVGARRREPAVSVLSVPPPIGTTAHDLADAVLDPRPFAAATGWAPVRDLRQTLHETVGAMAAEQLGIGTRI